MNHGLGRGAQRDRIAQGCDGQRGLHPGVHLAASKAAGPGILDRAQAELAFAGGCSVMPVSHRSSGLIAANWRPARSSCTGGPALRDRPRLLANTDQILCWEHRRCTLFSLAARVVVGELVSDEPVTERGSSWRMSSAALIRRAIAM